MALVRANAGRTLDTHAELDLPEVLPTVLTKVEVRTEGPMILDDATIGSLLVPETGASIDARIDDIAKEHVILDNPVLDIVGDGVRRVVGIDLCTVTRGSVTTVENVGREMAERKETTNST